MTHGDGPTDTAEFAALPLDAQRAELDRALAAGRDARALFAQCAALRDHAPLVHLTTRLVAAGYLSDAANRAWFARALAELPETGVHHVLKALGTRLASAAVTVREQLAGVLVEAVRLAPLAQLSALCVIDRALKQHFPERREHHVGRCVDRCAEAIRRGAPDELPLELLAQVPAQDHAALRALAHEAGVGAAFDARRAHLARACIEVLGRAPKALSQSNAEELLSRRVYTDPGHFLVELLQNAEDAQARTFRVLFDATRIVVHHDGVPFDARDLVGVTSIGQTTKRKQQIGFFGVGFKSVYEVTERPQIYSDVYQFEIVDVSVPRALGARPADLPRDGTLLVLPLREARDPQRSPAALFAKARALDACVLLTLRSLRAIELELTAAAGGPLRVALRATDAPDGAGVAIAREPGGLVQTYAVQDDEFRYPGSDREAGRPDRTRVMVGVATSARGVPQALPPGAPTLYSYLPTAETSGLRFFVQGHFDVPVDRERIAPESAWNRWILERVPEQLARLAAALTAHPDARARAAALLDLLPLPAELPSPAIRAVAAALPAALTDVPLLPCTDGALHRARETRLAPARVAALFDAAGALAASRGAAGRGGAATAGWFAAADALTPRAREVALALGARAFDTASLVEWLEAAARAGEPAPLRALRDAASGEFDGLFQLYELLGEELDRARDAGGAAAERALAARMAALPLVPDARGALRAAASGLCRAEPALRAVAAARPFVHPRLDDDGSGAPSRASPLLDRLGVARFTATDLLAELERALARGPRPLTAAALEARLGGSGGAALDAALAYLAAAPWDVATRAARLPVFRAGDGAFRAAAVAPDDRAGVLVVPPGPVGERLEAFYATHAPSRPLATARGEATAAALLARVNTPALGLEVLVGDLSAGALPRDPAALRALHALLESVRDELPARAPALLAALPIWPDRRGAARPLRGAGAVFIAASEVLAELLPDAPLLDTEVAARAHLSAMGVAPLGPDAVVAALAPDAAPPLRIAATPARVARVLSYLREHADALGADARAALAARPVLLDDRGEVCVLSELSLASTPSLRTLYGERPAAGRRFIDPAGESLALLAKLGLEGRVARAGADALVADLLAAAPALLGRAPGVGAHEPTATPIPFARDRAALDELHDFLAASAPRMGRDVLDRALDAPVYPAAGTFALGPLGDARAGRLDARYRYPCEPAVRDVLTAAGVPVLDAGAQARLAPLLEAARAPLAGIDAVIELLRPLRSAPPGAPVPALQTPAVLRAVQAMLVEHRDALARAYPVSARGAGRAPSSAVLSALAVWRTASGSVASADELVDDDAGELAARCAPGTPERATLDAARPADQETAQRLAALAPLCAPQPPARMLAHLVARHARPGAPLAAQPALLGTPARVAEVAASLRAAGEADATIRPANVPLLDARDRVRFDPLRTCDEPTAALLAGLAPAGELLHPALAAADALRGWTPRVSPVSPSEVLAAVLTTSPDTTATDSPLAVDAHPVLRDPARRAALYRWLAAREREVFADPACRALLADARAFVTTRGNLLRASELVDDPALPELGIDWRPGAEIPAETLALLGRHLGAGRLATPALIERHLRPAYVRAVAQGARDDAGAILAYLARALRGRPAAEVRALLRRPDGVPGEDFLLEDARGRFHRPEDMVAPPDELAHTVAAVWGESYPMPSPSRYPAAELGGFLADLGVPAAPALERVREVLARVAGGGDRPRLRAVAALCARLHREHGPRAFELLPLRQTAWVLDGTGCARRPGELFVRDADAVALVGDFGELYPDEAVATIVGERFAQKLGLRSAREATLAEVMHHLDARIAAGTAVPFAVYQWLERGLETRALPAETLADALTPRRWVLCDDGAYRRARDVLGTWAVPYFGARRGYWVRGRAECPRLCQLTAIADAVTPASVAQLFAQLAAEVARDGDRAVLARDEALPRMWLNGAALLGRARRVVDPAACVVLATERGAGAPKPRSGGGGGEEREGAGLRLVPATAPNLFRSDTPTLEALFDGAGRWFVAARGSADDRAAVDALHDALGVRRLRDAYAVELDRDDGGDRSEALAAELAALRGTLRALLAVIPRVRARRANLPATRWVYDARLRPLAAAGALHARAGLRVRYELAGVGTVRAASAAAYDHKRGALLVDASALADPDVYASELAAALMPCVYDGPGEDALTDVLEILLPLRTHERMSAYLDRRHFPAADATASARDRVAERVGELLDFGLHRALLARFPALAAGAFERWRDPAVLAPLDAEAALADRAAVARRAAPLLLAALALSDHEPDARVAEALAALLAAPTLAEAAASLLGVTAAPPPPHHAPPRPLATDHHDAVSPTPPSRAASAAAPPSPAARASHPATADPFNGLSAVAPPDNESEDGGAPPWSDPLAAPRASAPDASSAGLWSRVMRWLGIDEQPAAPAASAARDVEAPAWTHGRANCFAPQDAIGPQLWATPEARQRLAASPPAAALAYEPTPLPAPYLYAVQTLGAVFDPRTQRWSSADAPSLAALTARAPSTGRTVTFRGNLAPGVSLLPVPLWSRLTRDGVRVLDGDGAPLEVLGEEAGGAVRVRSRGAAEVTYTVELLEVPALTTHGASAPAARAAPALLAPTLAARELPAEVRRWLERERAAGHPAWARALAALRFVRARYAYDEGFLARPAVRRALAALEPGRGQHHLALLHAAGDEARLGYGICYELNLMVVELLRHLGVPALTATGWALDLGRVDRPDHLFALALVPTPDGPCALPLDAATDGAGPIHTLRPPLSGADAHPVERHEASRAAPSTAPALPSVGGPWSFEPTNATRASAAVAAGAAPRDTDDDAAWLDALRAAESTRLLAEHAALVRAVRLAARARNAAAPPELLDSPAPDSPAQRAARVAALRAALDQLLPDRELAGALLALVRGEFQHVAAVPPRVQELVALGLAQVRTVPAFQVLAAPE